MNAVSRVETTSLIAAHAYAAIHNFRNGSLRARIIDIGPCNNRESMESRWSRPVPVARLERINFDSIRTIETFECRDQRGATSEPRQEAKRAESQGKQADNELGRVHAADT